ncbi:hypothetical protein PULV_a3956 [Pseudoalteromonas ulvae UL12]|uniref:tyrosine-type recombinase/integrase n=1 Tax=Pseudoalteromonas ulvae TaxID=107327 RepID=UPI00186BA88E|nr:site-specific integrase [Pseudoalteromonas ulvae]MBE0362150.1 hypothetical protein [Pseudoalteromonas ulvae UL12]
MTPFFDTLEFVEAPNEFINLSIRHISTENKISDAGYVYGLAVDFLIDNSSSEQTFKAYRSELEKYLVWCWLVAKKPLCDIDRKDMRLYVDFLKSPDDEFIGTVTNSRFRLNKATGCREPNENWRPFIRTIPKGVIAKTGVHASDVQYKVKSASIKLSLSVLSSFYDYLIDLDYAEKNPPANLKRKNEFNHKSQVSGDVVKYFTEIQWQFVYDAASELALRDPDKHSRTRFLVSMLYGVYPRISELAARPGYSPLMSDFEADRNTGAFMFSIPISKGNKGRKVSVSDDLKNELIRYRAFLGLPSLPYPSEMEPLFCRHIKKGDEIVRINENLGDRQLRDIMQLVFDLAATRLRDAGLVYDADILLGASPHWLRHTGISHDININKRSLAEVRDDAGHDSIETTSIYLHTSSLERYLSAKNKKLSF